MTKTSVLVKMDTLMTLIVSSHDIVQHLDTYTTIIIEFIWIKEKDNKDNN